MGPPFFFALTPSEAPGAFHFSAFRRRGARLDTLPLVTATCRFLFVVFGGLLLASCAAPVVEKVIPLPDTGAGKTENYRLAPNDVVSITVFQEPDMATQQQIARDGSISFPLAGRVVIGGLSLGDAEKAIEKKLGEKYLVRPQVSIAVTEYAKQTYTVLGQVGAPGAYPVPYDEVIFTLPMAIARAGGNTRIGNLRNVRVNRWQDDSMSRFTVNMLSSEGQQFVIRPGDLITVQETLF